MFSRSMLSFVLQVFPLSILRNEEWRRVLQRKRHCGLKNASVLLCELTVSPRPVQWWWRDKENMKTGSGHGRETMTDTLQMEQCCPFHHGKSLHSWCRAGNDTRPRKPSTMTVHWSFFNIDALCFCGNKIVCVFRCVYKWQRFPCSMKTSPYLQSLSQYPWLSCTFLSAQGQDSGTERNAVDLKQIKESSESVCH